MEELYKCLFLRERHQSENTAHSMLPTIWPSGKGKTMKIVKRLIVKVRKEGGMNRAQIFRPVKLFCMVL